MKLYKVTLLADEREELEAITHKGSHQSQKVINALILSLLSGQKSNKFNWLCNGVCSKM